MFLKMLGLEREANKPAPGHASSPDDTPSQSDGPSYPPTLTAIPGGAARSRPTPAHGLSLRTVDGRVDEVGLVLDTLGSILTAFSRHAFDLPDRSAESISTELQRWQRHATMGIPVEPEAGNSMGVRDRDWDGVARTFTEHRRTEARYVDTAVKELREALWSVVESVHNAVKVDKATDAVADSQVQRARAAIARLQTGHIKQEVLGALSAIEDAYKARQVAQHREYESLAARIDRLGSQLEEAKKESTTDPLTGLGNRKLFDAMASRAVHLHALSRQPVVLLMIDLDKLKLVNDMYGHQAGDAAIAGTAKCLAKTFMRQTDVLCRYGGDEFAVILMNTDLKVARTLAARFRAMVGSMPSAHPAMEFAMGASVGIADYDGMEHLESWIARADKALYAAKQTVGERIVEAGRTVSDA